MLPDMICSTDGGRRVSETERCGGRATEKAAKSQKRAAGDPFRAVEPPSGTFCTVAHTLVGWTPEQRRSGLGLMHLVRCVKSDSATARPKSVQSVDLGQPELVMEWTCNKWTRGHAKNKHKHTANAVDKTKQGGGYLLYVAYTTLQHSPT